MVIQTQQGRMRADDAKIVADDPIDIRLLMLRLFAGKWWILGSMLLFGCIFLVAAFLTTPVYRGLAVLVPIGSDRGLGGSMGDISGQFGGLASLVGVNLSGSSSNVEEALAVLQSRQLTKRFIEENKLVPELFKKEWDAQASQWKRGAAAQPTDSRVFRKFKSLLRVTRDRKAGLVTVEIDWDQRQQVAQLVNKLVDMVNAELRARAIVDATTRIGFLEKELAATSVVDTRNAINRLIEAQIKQRMVASVTPEFAFRIIDRATTPDSNERVRPRKVLMLLVGLVLGLLCGVFFVLARDIFRGTRP